MVLGHDEKPRFRLLSSTDSVKPLVDELLEPLAQRRVVGEPGVNPAPVHGEEIHTGGASGRGHPGLVAHQRHLSETVPWAQTRQDLLADPGLFRDHLDLAVHHDVEPIATVSLTENDFAR